jgi:hypothetical protein
MWLEGHSIARACILRQLLPKAAADEVFLAAAAAEEVDWQQACICTLQLNAAVSIRVTCYPVCDQVTFFHASIATVRHATAAL